MKLYLAPMEGLTGHVYRNCVNEFTHGLIDKFYTPFIEPRPKKGMYKSQKFDLERDNNKGINLIPQILTKNPEDFLKFAKEIHETYGYEEINLNFGCPSKTVVARNKGAGMLEDTDDLKAFLDEIFKGDRDYDISIKTRLGMYDIEEMYRILEIYNQYPIKELSVHVRLQNEYYKAKAHMDLFPEISKLSNHVLSYNGDIYKTKDVSKLLKIMDGDKVDSIMLGRGFIGNPFLAEDIDAFLKNKEIRNYDKFDEEKMRRLRPFLDKIYEGYANLMDENTAVYRMKEIWAFMFSYVSDDKKKLKAIQKSKNRLQYENALRSIFD